MRLTIEPTAELLRIDGQDFRVWEGTDEHGTLIKAIVRAVSPQTHDPEVAKRFEERLKALPPLRAAGIVIDHRFLVD